MTADIEMLPCGECGMPCRPDEYHPFAACLMFKACRNSATVRGNLQDAQDHFTAPLQAEIEALRAEVADYMRIANTEATRAERLAEALRNLLDEVDDLTVYTDLDDEIGNRPCCQRLSYKPHSDDCAITIARAALAKGHNHDNQ